MEPPRFQCRAFRLPSLLRPCVGPREGRFRRHVAATACTCLGAAAGATASGLFAGAAPPGLRGPFYSGGLGGVQRGGGRVYGSRSGEFGDPARRWTDVLLVVNAALFGLQLLTQEGLTVWGIKINPLIVAGQYWRLLTPTFLHANLMHLVVNSASLSNLGPLLENNVGHARFVAVYLLAGFAGNVASFFGSTNPSLGASGAIFGIGGALAVYYYRNRWAYGKKSDFMLRQLWQTLVMNLAYSLFNPRIDNWGHMGGMLGGALAAFLLGPRYLVGRLPDRNGRYLLDKPPLPLLRSKPERID